MMDEQILVYTHDVAVSWGTLGCRSWPGTCCYIYQQAFSKVLIIRIYIVMISWFQDHPKQQSSWGQHGAHLGPVGPRWAPCWPHEPCYRGYLIFMMGLPKLLIWHLYDDPPPKKKTKKKTHTHRHTKPQFKIKMLSHQYSKGERCRLYNANIRKPNLLRLKFGHWILHGCCWHFHQYV